MIKDQSFASLGAHHSRARFFGQEQGQLAASPVLLELVNVSHSYGKIDALKGINLQIRGSEFIFLTGASGAGKSTLLNIISGELRPTFGNIVNGRENLFVTQVFQDLKLIENVSVLDNLRMANDPTIYRSDREFMNVLIEMGKVFGVYDAFNRRINSLNGGLKQKVAIMRALLPGPNLLVADEPTSSLDFESAKKLFDVLTYYNSKRTVSIVWASHNRELVRKFSGKMIHLEKGLLVHSGHACFI
ncbi:MAG: ATP-binding cassette domain-containing protein [Bdellovibrio sp.]|nr:ATP-binding cassette domain-containing protein [Bdellovibrio sp.]